MPNDAIGDYEGTVSPSYFQEPGNQAQDFLNKLPLRMGRVVRAHPPSADTSRSRRFWEYDVLLDMGSEHQASTRVLAPHCVIMSAFGGLADFTRWTPRLLEVDPNSADTYGVGTRVFVMHVDGSSFGGVILGGPQVAITGIPQGVAQGEPDTDRGHSAVWQFNGVRAEVFHDGSFTMSWGGPTTADGKPTGTLSPKLKGGTIAWDKEGSLHLASQNRMLVSSQGETEVSVGFGDIAAPDLSVNAAGNVTVRAFSFAEEGADGFISLETPGNIVKTSGLGVKLGKGDQAMVLGSTYRREEAVANAAVASGTGATAAAWTALSALLLSPGWLAIVAIGTAAGDPLIAAASVAATAAASSAAAAESTAASSVGQFEAKGPLYLSQVDFCELGAGF